MRRQGASARREWRRRRCARVALSSVTSWLSTSSRAMERPTAPAPAMATFICAAPPCPRYSSWRASCAVDVLAWRQRRNGQRLGDVPAIAAMYT